MAKIYTIDSSVFVNAFNSHEPGHKESRRLLALCTEQGVPINAPTLVLAEIAAAISRGRDDSKLALRLVNTLAHLSHLSLIQVDERLARQSADIAASQRLRGCDAIYVAVALRFGCPLITLDRQQRERAAAVVTARAVSDVLAKWLK